MLGVMCIKIGLITAAAARLGWLFCGAEQGQGDNDGNRVMGKDVPPFPEEGWQSSGMERTHVCSRDPPEMHSSLLVPPAQLSL